MADETAITESIKSHLQKLKLEWADAWKFAEHVYCVQTRPEGTSEDHLFFYYFDASVAKIRDAASRLGQVSRRIRIYMDKNFVVIPVNLAQEPPLFVAYFDLYVTETIENALLHGTHILVGNNNAELEWFPEPSRIEF